MHIDIKNKATYIMYDGMDYKQFIFVNLYSLYIFLDQSCERCTIIFPILEMNRLRKKD
jgi:hypothetical protein